MIRTGLDEFLEACGAKGIALDTGVGVLLTVGRTDPSLISRFKRTAAFTERDYEMLERLVSQTPRLVTTPNVRTEVSNLVGQLAEPARTHALKQYRLEALADDERYYPTAVCVNEPGFVRLELADTSILVLGRKGYGVLTIDLDLYCELLRDEAPVLNFHHLRTWLLE